MTRATETFARRMREERQRAGLTQVEVAERLTAMLERPVYDSALARVEKHLRAIRLDEAVAIADVLELPLSALLRDREHVDEEIAQLRQELDEAQWRANETRVVLQRAEDSVESIRRRLEQLEAAREG